MKQLFYTNMDVLETRGLSRYDFVVAAMVTLALTGAVFAYFIILGGNQSFSAKMGMATAYGCTLLGAGLHLYRQTKTQDELVNTILNKAIARAGISTIVAVPMITIIGGLWGDPNVGMWVLIAPVMFVLIAWRHARSIAKAFNK